MKQAAILLLMLCSLLGTSQDSQKYWVFLTDKEGSTFDPYEYFDVKAIENRLLNNISLYDKTDYPLNQNYIKEVSLKVESVKMKSRWLNALVCFATEQQVDELNSLPFVKKVERVYNTSVSVLASKENLTSTTYESELSEADEYVLKRQVEIMGLDYFKSKRIDGSGVRVAIFDAGFPTVDTNPCFEHIRNEKRIISTFDFVKKKEFVYDYSSHGTMVLSCVAGKIEGKNIGMATGSEFLLARTEDAKKEPFSEEENWLAAAEWADKNGATVINSSLGYTHNRYFYSDMNGSSYVSKAANMAASKGILVVNAAGNEGDGDWNFMGAPADADSVLSVGGIDPETEAKVDFSSYGPTYDNRMKPNVAAFGWAIASDKKGLKKVPGTSFASPLVCGFAACARQAYPELKTMDLFRKIEESGNLFPYFDYGHGYGIPNAKKMYEGRSRRVIAFSIEEKDGFYRFKKQEGKEYIGNKVYCHISNEKGVLRYWNVKEVLSSDFNLIKVDKMNSGEILRVFFDGQVITEYKK